jgi:hypothetical protein
MLGLLDRATKLTSPKDEKRKYSYPTLKPQVSGLLSPTRMQVSALGQSRRFDYLPPTSALPPSDIVSSARQVRFVPQPDSCTAAISSERACGTS